MPNIMPQDSRAAYTAGGVAAALILLALWAVGTMGGHEAASLLEATLPTIRFLCSTAAAAAVTILALMLTALSVSQGVDDGLDDDHYSRVRQISMFSIGALIGSVFLLMFLVVPLGESDKVPVQWFTALYYFILSATAVLGGLLVMISLMLYQAIEGMIGVLHPSASTDEGRPEA